MSTLLQDIRYGIRLLLRSPALTTVAALSLAHGVWQRRFGARQDIVGDTITVNGRAFTVIGVTAEGFRGTNTIGGPELWVPFGVYREVTSGFLFENWDSRRAL